MITEVIAARYSPTLSCISGLAVERPKKVILSEFNLDIKLQFSNLYLIL